MIWGVLVLHFTKSYGEKFRILKQMGVNAVRLAHNMSAPEVNGACR